MLRKKVCYWVALPVVIVALSCATSPLGRKQLLLVPDTQMNELGVQSFDQMKQQVPIDKDPAVNSYVQCVSKAIVNAAGDEFDSKNFEVVVFQSDEANAFALPGGKIGVFSGMLNVAKTSGQLAAVIGHEVGHVIARHGNERLSETLVAQGGLAALGAVTASNPNSGVIMGALGIGTQLAVLLPHSRDQEEEADLIGLDLMAKAGFDPEQSVELWQNMVKAESSREPPEFLSTHPATSRRIETLKSNLPAKSGTTPFCKRPESRA